MEFYNAIQSMDVECCTCDDHCGADSWGCDNQNEG